MTRFQLLKKVLDLYPVLNLSRTIQGPFYTYENQVIDYKQFTFPGGEEHIRIDKGSFDLIQSADNMMIIGDTTSSKGIMNTVLATDAIRSLNQKINITLFIPYFPYARQDRRMVPGEPFSLKLVSDIINLQNYYMVEIFDPHSDVTTALLNNLSVIPSSTLVKHCYHQIVKDRSNTDYVIVSPDAGAEKKVFKAMSEFGRNSPPILCCTKTRDVVTGKLMGSVIPSNIELKNKHCIILDDIIDGGGTFIELANKLKDRGARTVQGIVSHGIFSQGFDKLKMSMDKIYTSDSFTDYNDDFVTTIPLLKMLPHEQWYCTGKIREPFSSRFIQ